MKRRAHAGSLNQAAASLAGKKVAVVGDMVLDEFIYGNTERVSREAPVLILKYDHREVVPGGAANAVNNIKALGGVPYPVGVIGDDEAGRSLVQYFHEQAIETTGLVMEPGVATICKTRIMAGGYHTTRQQLIRIDKEHGEHYSVVTRRHLHTCLDQAVLQAEAVLLSDYGYGVLADETRRRVLSAIQKNRKPSVVDSRYRLTAFAGVGAATPNEVEATQAMGIALPDGRESDLVKWGAGLLKKLRLQKGLIVTRGRLGMAVFEPGCRPVFLPIVGSDEVADVTGAGDTVSSVVVLGLAAGWGLLECARLATYAASVVVMKRGTATVTPLELQRAIGKSSITART